MTRFPEKKTILFVHASADLYGADVSLLHLIQSVDRGSFDPIVLLPEEGPLVQALRSEGARVLVLAMPKIARGVFNVKGLLEFATRSLAVIPPLRRLIAEEKVALVHSNTMAAFAGALASRLFGVKHLWHVHEIIKHPAVIEQLLPRLVGLAADVVVANSRETSRWLRGIVPGIERKTVVIMNGVDSSRFNGNASPEDFRREWGIAADETVFGLIGRVNRLKGHQVFVRAAEMVLREFPLAHFFIVGGPPAGQGRFLTELEQCLERLPRARTRTRIIPFRRDIERVYAGCDVIVMPSTEPESFGLVAAEAMAMKKPVIASRLGGLLDVVAEGETGLMVRPGDASDLARAMLALARDRDRREELGERGLARQRAVFSFGRFRDQVADLYRQILTPSPVPGDLLRG